jgi:hypothetical protein
MPARQLQIHEGGMELARSLQQSILQRQEELGRLQVKALQENTDSNRKLDITVKDVIGNIGKQIGRLGSRE